MACKKAAHAAGEMNNLCLFFKQSSLFHQKGEVMQKKQEVAEDIRHDKAQHNWQQLDPCN